LEATRRPQKVKVFASASSAGLEREMNSWLKGNSPVPVITDMQVSGWGEGGGAGGYTIVAIVIYE
jgi:hypothetical protein